MTRPLLTITTLIAAALANGASRLAQPPLDPALVSSGFIYDAVAPTPQCHASTIVQTPSGLVAAWFGGEHERHPEVQIWIARQVAGAWTTPVAVVDGVQADGRRHPTWNPVLFTPRGGPLMLFYKVGPSPSTWWGMVMTSSDDGRSWSSPTRLPDGVLGPIKNKPVQLASGTVVSGSSTEHDGWRVHMERSTDGGRSWRSTPALNDGKALGAIQPAILVHPDGRLQALGRTRNARVFSTESRDEGEHWSEMTLLELPNPNAGTDAITLTDGRFLLVYNHTLETGKDRGTLNVAVSADGKNWQAALVLEDDAAAPAGFSYPAVIQTSDGLVHITYTWKRTRIRHVVLDPRKLTLRPITNGSWPR